MSLLVAFINTIIVLNSVSGCTDYFATNEEDAFKMCREIVESLNMKSVPPPRGFQEPKFGIEWEGMCNMF